jgi:dTDP-4-amino-4,6-dideoxygalactose transaminase
MMTIQKKMRLMKAIVGEQELEALARVIEDGYLGMGVEVQAFERELHDFLGGGGEVTCVSTCTAALHLALQACGIGPGDEVLVPTFTFLASYQAISATGATPLSCDVDPGTAFIDIADARNRITSRTRAIMPVHYSGGTGDLAGVYDLARRAGLRVVEDAAQAFGCTHRGTLLGSTGDIVCFSFDGVKHVTSGEGGAVVTADREVARKVQDARLLAVEKDTEKRFANQRSWDFDVTEQGWRFHMSNLLAAIGRVQLTRFWPEFAPRRVEVARNYLELLRDLLHVRTLDFDYGPVVPWSFPVFISGGKRDEVRDALASEGIESGISYKPNHLLAKYGGGCESFPVAEQMYAEVLTLPLHPEIAWSDQQRVVDTMRRVLRD